MAESSAVLSWTDAEQASGEHAGNESQLLDQFIPPVTLAQAYSARSANSSNLFVDIEDVRKTGNVAAVVGVDDPSSTSEPVAEWHGIVTEIDADHITAEMSGIFGDGVAGSKEEAIIPRSDLRASDADLLVEGAFFRLCVSYEVSASLNRRRFTEVVFRRTPGYTQRGLDEAKRRARELSDAIQLE